MGIAHGPAATCTQGAPAQGEDSRRHSGRFRAAKRNIATVAARHEEHRDGLAVPGAVWYIHPRLGPSAQLT